jgi:signal transduction histidine kinase
LFTPFYTTKSKGLGLGLAISRSIVEAHNGKLSLVPSKQQGATFQLLLPVAEEAMS